MSQLQNPSSVKSISLSRVGTLVCIALLCLGCSPTPPPAPEKSEIAVQTATVMIPVEGMTCESCENFLRGRLTAMSGIVDATASHVEKHIEIVYNPAEISIEKMVEAINTTNYKATLPTATTE